MNNWLACSISVSVLFAFMFGISEAQTFNAPQTTWISVSIDVVSDMHDSEAEASAEVAERWDEELARLIDGIENQNSSYLGANVDAERCFNPRPGKHQCRWSGEADFTEPTSLSAVSGSLAERAGRD